MTTPKILALDFDGVICDTLHEVLRSAWQVYREVWNASGDHPPPEAAVAFATVRPVLEIGWEAPVLLRAIMEGVPEAAVLEEFQTTWRQRIVEEHHLSPADLTARFDAVRDNWIRTDLAGWLGCQEFYPGIAARLRTILRSKIQFFVITTKGGPYAHLLLERNGVSLPVAHVWGKECARPKPELLQALFREMELGDIWFVEDRLKTLRTVEQQKDLDSVRLFLATWGYNTPAERGEVRVDKRIVPLTLDQFCSDFSAWTRS